MARKLGKVQAEVLDCVRRHGYYNAGCGWVWDTHSNTKRILDTLVKRGDVKVTVSATPGGGIDVYEPVERAEWVEAYQLARNVHHSAVVAEMFADAVLEGKYEPTRAGRELWFTDTVEDMRNSL